MAVKGRLILGGLLAGALLAVGLSVIVGLDFELFHHTGDGSQQNNPTTVPPFPQARTPITPPMAAEPSQAAPPTAPPSSTAATPSTPAVTAEPSQAAPPTAPPSSTATTPSAPATPPLPAEGGMSESDRRQIQEALRRLNYYHGPIDGIFGPLTRAAIRRFQQDVGVDSTGSLTAEEANRLIRRR